MVLHAHERSSAGEICWFANALLCRCITPAANGNSLYRHLVLLSRMLKDLYPCIGRATRIGVIGALAGVASPPLSCAQATAGPAEPAPAMHRDRCVCPAAAARGWQSRLWLRIALPAAPGPVPRQGSEGFHPGFRLVSLRVVRNCSPETGALGAARKGRWNMNRHHDGWPIACQP